LSIYCYGVKVSRFLSIYCYGVKVSRFLSIYCYGLCVVGPNMRKQDDNHKDFSEVA